MDIPNAPETKTIDNTTSAKITWDNVTGQHDGILLLDQLTYNIYQVTSNNEIGEKLSSVSGNTTEYTVTGLNNNDGKQGYAKWAVNAENSAGASQFAVASLIVGKPYVLPYHNSF